jgi:membrane-bound lytic murein transglycosylase B
MFRGSVQLMTGHNRARQKPPMTCGPNARSDLIHYAALKLIDRGVLTARTRGAMTGEVGYTQFLSKNILLYGVNGGSGGRINLNSKADALASTANFLKAHGWVRGAGYQPGQPNFAALRAWNAANVYAQAIAVIGRQIDAG